MFKMKKSLALVVSLVLVLTVTVGTTLAYLIAESGPVKNTFTPSHVTTAVVESFDGTEKKDVKIQNTGNTDAWIRATIVVTWQDANGNVYGQKPVAGTDYSIDWGSSDWLPDEHGYYYWTYPVAPGETTSGNLIDSITAANPNTAPAGYSLCVQVLGSGIQSKPAIVFGETWNPDGIVVTSDGTELVKIN